MYMILQIKDYFKIFLVWCGVTLRCSFRFKNIFFNDMTSTYLVFFSDHCGEVFVHSTSLTRHIRRKHQNDFVPDNKKASLSAKCPICNQTFYKTSINKHIRIKHEGQKPYVCEICKMGFVTKNNLENHQWQHKGIRSRPFKCQLCRKAYLRASQLEAHMR